MDSLTQGIGGPKAIAVPGDYVLENDRIRVAIRGERPSFGPHTTGGSIIDADLQRNDPRYTQGHGNDLLGELFPTVNLNIARAHPYNPTELQSNPRAVGKVELIADGSDGGPAIVCAEGPAEPFISLLGGLWLLLGGGDFRIRTDYILEPGTPAVLVRTYAIYGPNDDSSACDASMDQSAPALTSEETLDILTLALEEGGVLGDFFLQGGSLNVFAPGIGFDEEGYVFELSEEGVNTFQSPIPVDYLAGAGDNTSYGLIPASGKMFVPLFTASQTVAVGAGQAGDGSPQRFPSGTQLYYDRYFTIGRGDVGSALEHLLEARGDATGAVSGHVLESGTHVALSGVQVFAYRAGEALPYTEWTTDIGDDPRQDGSFGGTIPPGDYELQVHGRGRPLSERVPITVNEGDALELTLSSPQPASVVFDVVDGSGLPIPSKVTFFREDGERVLIPELGDSFIGGQPAEVVFAPEGSGQVVLPPGEYFAVASRGIEYELGTSSVFEIGPEKTVELELAITRSVDTTGWVGADFHVHSSPSFDSGVRLEDRVITMVCEGVEFFSSTDHDAITDFAPVIERMEMEPWVKSAVGLEVSTIEVGHFLGFPLLHDYLSEGGLALDWTGLTPDEIIDGFRDLGMPGGIDPIVFIGHPRDGILGYFDQFALNTYLGQPGELVFEQNVLNEVLNPLLTIDNFSTNIDALEMLNAKRLELIRAPTQPELDAYLSDPNAVSGYDLVSRTMEEQQALIDGTYRLGFGHEGQIDDWFALNNLGFRYTVLANSDTHGKTSTEAGCPRNFVAADTDDPAYLDEEDIARAVRDGRVVASYGPFIRFYANGDDQLGPGSDVTDTDTVELYIEVQSPSWFTVDRIELIENGTLIEEFLIEEPTGNVIDFSETVLVEPSKDSWYVVVAIGDDDMGPVFNPVEIPPIQLQDVVTEVLQDLDSALIQDILPPLVPIPRAFPVLPYAITNPIWIDHDGDNQLTPPGLPSWLLPPIDPNAETE
ncbi:MAG: CehA/McbA family metallohydrolase [Myxococcota bacterium]